MKTEEERQKWREDYLATALPNTEAAYAACDAFSSELSDLLKKHGVQSFFGGFKIHYNWGSDQPAQVGEMLGIGPLKDSICWELQNFQKE